MGSATIVDSQETSTGAGLQVAKRRVPVTVYLANKTIEGELYADTHQIDGSEARLVDRLADPWETFTPLAVEERHILVRKSRILAVELDPSEVPRPCGAAVTALKLFFQFTNGLIVCGTVYALLAPAGSRPLDFLNRSSSRFLNVFSPARVTLVNMNHVVDVTELDQAG